MLCRRRDDAEAPPPPLRDEADAPPTTAFRGHAEGPALDRVRLKYVAGLADVAWILNNCQSWPGDHARPTLIIIDDVAALSTTSGVGRRGAAPPRDPREARGRGRDVSRMRLRPRRERRA